MSQGSDEWYDLPRAAAGISLYNLREKLRQKNLHDTEEPPLETSATPPAGDAHNVRTVDGTIQRPEVPAHGQLPACGSGATCRSSETFPDIANLMNPSPRQVSLELLTRTTFQPATILNVIAAAWIQFMVHDWFVHKKGSVDARPTISRWATATAGTNGRCACRRLRPKPPKVAGSKRPPAYINENTHWWDGSQVYGSTPVDTGVAPCRPRRQGAGQPERAAGRGSGHRQADHRFHRERVGGTQPAARAVCARAQRHLRQAQEAQSALGRRAAVPAGASRQRRAAREDSHRRVVDGDPAAGGPHARACGPTGTAASASCRTSSRSSPTTTSSQGFPVRRPITTACRSR